ncbi:MAG: ABC transporter permease [Helicobacter sp.]|nr:ABC transporter permease [Helicobacter sp.]
MRFLEILLAEYRAIFSNKIVVVVIIVGSMVYGILYPMPYLNDNVLSQKLLIVDEDKSTLSRELVFLVGASPQITLFEEVDSLYKAQTIVENFQAQGILFIPKGFESSAYIGVGSIVSYMGNASYFLIYGAIIEGIHSAIDELAHKISSQANPDALSLDVISYEPIALFNPSLGYINYALAAVLVFILHQTLIGGSAILGAYQNRISVNLKIPKDLYTNTDVPYFLRANISSLILARVLAFSSIYCVWFLFYFGVLFVLFGVNIHASASDFWCFALMFIFCCAMCGIFLGVCLKDESLPTQIVFISSMPLVFIMGFIWPSELLPAFLRNLSYFIPAYHGIKGFINLNQMGASFSDIAPHFFALLTIFFVCFIGSYFVLKTKHRAILI